MELSTYNSELDITDLQIEGVFDTLDISPDTRGEYLQRIRLFVSFMRGKRLSYNTYLEYKKYLGERNDFSISTKNKYLFTAKIFLKELYRRGLIPADITSGVKGFKQSKKHKRTGLTDEEVGRIIEKFHLLEETPMILRLKALFCLLALQGLREIEIVRLNVGDFDFVRKTAFVQGKGEDDKEPIDLHPETITAVQRYIKAYRIADGSLFVSLSNRGKNNRITTRSIRRIIDGLHSDIGIEKSGHGYRHYFTTRLIKVYKGDLLAVRQRTRHKSLEMLQVYNDNILQEEDLPRYYGAFEGVTVK